MKSAAGLCPPDLHGKHRHPTAALVSGGVLGTGVIPAELSANLAAHFRMLRKDGAALSSEKRSGWGVQSILAQLVLVLDLIPGLERVALVRLDPDRMVHLLNSLLSVRVDLYLTSRRLFTFQGEFSAEVLPPVVGITHEAFAERRSIRAVPQVYHVIHLGGISLLDWHTIPCESLGKTAGS